MTIFLVGKAIEPPDDGKHVMWSDMLSSSPFSKSLDDSESLYMLPYYLKPKEEPTRKILTISTLQLHRAINDRIQDEINLGPKPIPRLPRMSTSTSIQEVFPFDKPRMKVVGGGGVIAKYESPFRSKVITNSGSLSSRTLPSHMTLHRGDLGRENIHAEIRLDQVKKSNFSHYSKSPYLSKNSFLVHSCNENFPKFTDLGDLVSTN